MNVRPSPLRPASTERTFYFALTLSIVIAALAGFARTYYLHGFFDVPAPRPLIWIHGAVMTGWVVMLAAQSALIRRRQIRWHRRLGWVSLGYAAVMVALGCASTVSAAHLAAVQHSAFLASQLDVLALELMQMTLFAGIYAAAMVRRARPDWHKRLMIAATLCLLPNVIVRFAMLTPRLPGNTEFIALWTVLVLLVIGADTLRVRRLHPAFAISGAIAIAGLCGAHMIGTTEPWRAWALRLVA